MKNEYYDLTVLQNLTVGDAVFMQDMVNLFLEKTPAEVDAMLAAASEHDWKELAARAHKVKSTLRSMGVHSLSDKILSIEQDAKHNENTADLPDRVTAFNELFRTVCTVMKDEKIH